jgi:hypothetical protein
MSLPLPQDPQFADTTVLVVTASLPRRSSDLLELGALPLRYAGFGYVDTGERALRCVPDPSAALDTTIGRSGLRPDQVRGRPPAAIALAFLDAHLTRPPYLVATHGPVLGQMIAAHADSCPVLADLTILDTARLARHVYRGANLRLEQWADRLALDTSALTGQTSGETLLATALFMHLMHELLRDGNTGDLAWLLQIAQLERPRHPGAALISGKGGGRRAWTPARASA